MALALIALALITLAQIALAPIALAPIALAPIAIAPSALAQITPPINRSLIAIPNPVINGPQSPRTLQRRAASNTQIPAVFAVAMMRRTQRIAVCVIIASTA